MKGRKAKWLEAYGTLDEATSTELELTVDRELELGLEGNWVLLAHAWAHLALEKLGIPQSRHAPWEKVLHVVDVFFVPVAMGWLAWRRLAHFLNTRDQAPDSPAAAASLTWISLGSIAGLMGLQGIRFLVSRLAEPSWLAGFGPYGALVVTGIGVISLLGWLGWRLSQHGLPHTGLKFNPIRLDLLFG